MKYHISNLTENDVVHCTTEEEAKQVLQIAHDYGLKWCSKTSFLDCTFFYSHKSDTCYWLRRGEFSSIDFYQSKNLNIIPAQEFIDDNFVLPKKWDIVATEETVDIIAKRFDENWTRHATDDFYQKNKEICRYRYGINPGNVYFWKSNDEYPEITFAQFQKYVLKNQNDMKKKIIGYKCPTDLFGGDIPKGSIYKKILNSEGTYAEQSRWQSYSGTDDRLMPAEIVETWEPVYKEDEYQVGDWIIGDSNISYQNCVAKLNCTPKAESAYVMANCYSAKSFNTDGIYFFKNTIRKATKEEIENHLIQVAKEKGFTHSTKFIAVRDTEPHKELGVLGIYSGVAAKKDGKVGRNFVYNMDTDTLCVSGFGLFVVYSKGEWAEIINNKTVIDMRSDKGVFQLEISKDGIYYPPEKVWLNLDEIENLAHLSEIQPVSLHYGKQTKKLIDENRYEIKHLKIDVGCKTNTYLEDWKQVWETYQKFQND